MANAPGDDGYIVLGVKSEKGKPREVVGISGHHDSADLAAIVNGVIEEPVQFEYYPVAYKGIECAIIHIPRSVGRPHWSKKDFGMLRKRVFYTRRASGNTEASIEEIRQMCLETIRLSDVAKRKAKKSGHVADELAKLDLEERKSRMYEMLQSISSEIGLSNYRLMVYKRDGKEEKIGALVGRYSDKGKREFVVFMHPWSVKMRDISATRRRLMHFINLRNATRRALKEVERLKVSTLVHVAYKNISTSGQERRTVDGAHTFANEIEEDWGRIIKWQHLRVEMSRYEFFIPNVSSREELKERLMESVEWGEKNIKD